VSQILEHTAKLQQASDQHATRIGSLQRRVSNITADLLSLGDNERRHFRTALGILLLAAVVIGVMYLKQDGDTVLLTDRIAERSVIVDNGLGAVNSELGTSTRQINKQIGVLNQDLNDKIVMLDDRVNAVDRKLQDLDDRTSSLNGRLAADSPLDNFGGDNTVHGTQWLRELPATGWMIQLTRVADDVSMYELTRSYSSYLSQPVSYFVDANGGRVLLYGNFDSEAAAQAALRRLPWRFGDDQPMVRSVASVQRMI
jgi:hypothetical protein